MRDHPLAQVTVPGSTYRLQLHAEFGFADAADLAGYLSSLGVTHAYLSPILQAAPGSRHGYDVVDHSRISAELGGEDGFRYLARRLARHGMGLVVDVVPNHMGIPSPEYLNRELWSVLAGGQQSAHAHWFDIDWAALDGQMLLPILARPPKFCLDDLKVSRLAELPGAAAVVGDADAPVLRYQGHVLPLRAGTERLPLPDLLAAQHYRLESWRAAATQLNWRRFFDISSLIAVRVEEPDVFAATHGLLLGLVAEGLIDGLRIDHPDGLADPRAYLRQLTTAAGGHWIVAEKILAAGEELPRDWSCAGTTGYDALAAVGAVLTSPAGAARLGAEYQQFAGGPPDFATVAYAAKHEIAGQLMAAEIGRLARLIGRLDEPVLAVFPAEDVQAIVAELVAGLGVYRAYVVPGEPPPAASLAQLGSAAAAARRHLAARLYPGVDAVAALLLGRGVAASRRALRDELIVRFQQTCAAVQAKGVEDTAGYRWTRLVSANEVGADPDRPAMTTAEFHAFARRLSEDWPATMTALSTHDAKRQEDVRARLAVLAEMPADWARAVAAWHDRAVQLAPARPPDPPTEYLLWQTLVGAWPIDGDRLASYLRKAMREAKLTTSWTEPDSRYEAAVISFARLALTDDELSGQIAAFVDSIGADARANSLSAKLVQLTMPGVPDVYQGCELEGLALVDPDNRQPVDFARRQTMLAVLDREAAMMARGLDAAKLLVTSRALRLRRDHPGWFAGDYQPLQASGVAAAHVAAFCRSDRAITVATRLPADLRQAGGWRDTALRLAPGRWHDVLTGAHHKAVPARRSRSGGWIRPTGEHNQPEPAGWLRLDDLLVHLPVALLVRAEDDTAHDDTGRTATG
ncbi:MAG TPA: malto-oligosyltrehalose synthase [Streptosporangiaceae bacterium]|nr:malto-oligosyltrehalose synthase [Streptosporangiaceae bacterium]